MKITVAGIGYVELVNEVTLAEMGQKVVCIDRDETKVNALQKGIPAVYKSGVEVLPKKNNKAGRLCFTAKFEEIILRLKPPPVYA